MRLITMVGKFNSEHKSFSSKFEKESNFGLPQMITF